MSAVFAAIELPPATTPVAANAPIAASDVASDGGDDDRWGFFEDDVGWSDEEEGEWSPISCREDSTDAEGGAEGGAGTSDAWILGYFPDTWSFSIQDTHTCTPLYPVFRSRLRIQVHLGTLYPVCGYRLYPP